MVLVFISLSSVSSFMVSSWFLLLSTMILMISFSFSFSFGSSFMSGSSFVSSSSLFISFYWILTSSFLALVLLVLVPSYSFSSFYRLSISGNLISLWWASVLLLAPFLFFDFDLFFLIAAFIVSSNLSIDELCLLLLRLVVPPSFSTLTLPTLYESLMFLLKCLTLSVFISRSLVRMLGNLTLSLLPNASLLWDDLRVW